MLQDTNSQWTEVLVNKYMGGKREIINIKRKYRASNAWTGIVAAAPILKEGWRKIPRSGKNTNFWTDAWILGDPLFNHASRRLIQIAYNVEWWTTGRQTLDGNGMSWKPIYRIMS